MERRQAAAPVDERRDTREGPNLDVPPAILGHASLEDREEKEIRNLCASVGCSDFAENFVAQRLSLWQVQRALLEVLCIVLGPKPGSWRAFRSHRGIELDVFEKGWLSASRAQGRRTPDAASAPRPEVLAEFAAALRAGPASGADSELEHWFGRDLDADPYLTIVASPRLTWLIEHDALAGAAARQLLHALKKQAKKRRAFLATGLHIVGDRGATCRRRSRQARPFYRGSTRWPTPGRYFDLAVAEYVEAQRMFRHRLRLVAAVTGEEPRRSLTERALAVRAHLQRLHPGATWQHVVRVLERNGNNLGEGDLATKRSRLQVAVSSAKSVPRRAARGRLRQSRATVRAPKRRFRPRRRKGARPKTR